MAFSLYQATVPTFLQILPSVAGLVEKARAHCAECGAGDEALCEARLADDMWPFSKQVTSACHHSAGAIASLEKREFSPDLEPGPASFDVLAARVADAIAALETVSAAELDAIADEDTRFRFLERQMDFTVADFLLSFSMPNFYFHATTAYAVLRNQGLNVGKMDYMGRPRLKA